MTFIPGEDAWSSGNHVRPLVHGATYFAELKERIEETRAGDLILFTDWRGDPDERAHRRSRIDDGPSCSAPPIAAASTFAA